MSDGTWENPVDVRQHMEFVDCDGVKLPVLNLEYEESTYREVWRRIDKADMIRDWLAGHGTGRTRPRR